jgi:hypothetical protein
MPDFSIFDYFKSRDATLYATLASETVTAAI